jgi:hypothetical protein
MDEIVKTSLPGSPEMQAHTAEVLRQVKGARVKPGGWTGGDAWFGSVMTSVEVMKRLGVHSTFIVKNNTLYYPMGALFAILEARHAQRPAGHWVVMRTTIADVPLIAMAYGWSQRGVSYFISTCGSMEPCPKNTYPILKMIGGIQDIKKSIVHSWLTSYMNTCH